MSGPGAPPFDAWSLPADLEVGSTVLSGSIRHPAVDRDRLAGWMERLAERTPMLVLDEVEARIRALGTIGEALADPGHWMRAAALDQLPGQSGLSPEMCRSVVDRMAEHWTPPGLRELFSSEFDAPDDDRAKTSSEAPFWAPLTPALHVGSGSVPGVSLTSALRALLVGAAVLIKPGRGDVTLTVLARRLLEETAPEWADRLAVCYWPGETQHLDQALRTAAVLVVYGDDRTIEAHRRSAPATVSVVEYPHRTSAALVGVDRMTRASAEALAGAVAAYDGRGCVSPRVAFVECEDVTACEAWAEQVTEALARIQARCPAGRADGAVLAHARQVAEHTALRRAAGHPVRVFHDPELRWLVLLDDSAATALPIGRTVQVWPVTSLGVAVERLARWRPHLQSVGVDVGAPRLPALHRSLTRAGALRVTRIADLPWPRPSWRHDGRGPLRDLVRRVEVESFPGDPR